MMARKLLVVATAPAWERYLWIRELRPGDIHRTRRVIIRPGGKGVHVALAATRLGLMPKVLGIVDPGTSRDFSGSLLREGIEAGFVAGEGLTRTCTCIVDERSGLMTEVDEPATAVSEAEWSQLLTHARSSCEEGAEVLAISGSLPKSVPPERVGELVRAASSVGVLTVLDTSGQALVAGLTAGPDWVKVNEHEARDVLGTSVKSSGTELAQGLQQRGGKNAVVTMGERGCVAVLENGETLALVGRTVARSTAVGSGDCFLAGLAAGLTEGRSPERSLRLATAAAGLNAASVLVAEFTREEAERHERLVGRAP